MIVTADTLTAEVCDAYGYRGRETAQANGRTITDVDVAAATTAAYLAQRKRFPMICGNSRREERQRQRMMKQAVAQDVADTFGVSIPENALVIGLGLLLGILGGPVALIIAIVSVVFQYFLERELHEGRASELDQATRHMEA